MLRFNTVTLLKKSIAALTTMQGHFARGAFDDGPLLPEALQQEIAVLIDNLGEHYGQLERSGKDEKRQAPKPTGKDRKKHVHAKRGMKGKKRFPKGVGKGGYPTSEEIQRRAKALEESSDEGLMI